MTDYLNKEIHVGDICVFANMAGILHTGKQQDLEETALKLELVTIKAILNGMLILKVLQQ